MNPAVTSKRDGAASFDRGDIGFIITSGGLASFMVPGLAFLYAGLARRKSALALIWAVFLSNSVVIFQWLLFGYSLAFSTSKNGFMGNLHKWGLRGVLGGPSPGSPLLPELLYSFLQMEIAAVTVGILVGAIAERGRVLPAMLFSFLWVTLVYCPLAYWAWGTHGWAFSWGVLDFSGGGPVEIGSGVSGLAYALILGKRQEKEAKNFRPYNVSLVALGTGILWLGWIGFNAGSAFGANMRAVVATWNSFLCAALGGITWCLIDFRLEKKYTVVGFCSGTIAGLVASTPSSGFVPPWSSVLIGIFTGAICNYGTKVKYFLHIDDTFDLFALHGIGGIIGLLANGFFGDSTIVALDGVSQVEGGFINHNWKQMHKQAAYIGACVTYSFAVTALLAKGMDVIPWLRLRVSAEAEAIGLDEDQIGEFASDYIEVKRDVLGWAGSPTASLQPISGVREKRNILDIQVKGRETVAVNNY